MQPDEAMCGLDFGTSNSTFAVLEQGKPKLVPLEGSNPILRSAIYYDPEGKLWEFGNPAVHHYLENNRGRLMMSLKSILGSSLMQEKTYIDGKAESYADILGFFIRYMKQSAETTTQQNFEHVVLGRPVKFNDNDSSKDRLAEDTLRDIAKKQGFKHIAFQYEPVAAALDYEQQLTKEVLALVIDLGGGTSDFSIIRLGPARINHDRQNDVLASDGIHIGGTDLDTILSLKSVMPHLGYGSKMQGSSSIIDVPNSYYYDLTTWHTLSTLYTSNTLQMLKEVHHAAINKQAIHALIDVVENRKGHKLLHHVELVKRKLSDHAQIALDLPFLEIEIQLEILRSQFETWIQTKIDGLLTTLHHVLHQAQIKPHQIGSIFFTGGTSKIPMIQRELSSVFPGADVIKGDTFGSVGIGLALEAKRIFC